MGEGSERGEGGGVKIQITQRELDSVLEAAKRVAHRTNTRLVVLWDRIDLVEPATMRGKEAA